MTVSVSTRSQRLKRVAQRAALLLTALLLNAWAGAVERNKDVEKQSTFVFENDMFTFDDGGYTNGFAYYWQYGPFESFDGRTPGWMQALTCGPP